jgi:NitT/TauT family transport system ATP-binding protein
MTAFTYAETLLEVKDVSLAFGTTQVLRNVNVEVKNILREGHTQGQVVGFLGPSGVGKTQFFRILAGLNKPTSGTVLVGADKKPVEAGMVGVVAQHYPLFGHRTVWGNLLVAGEQAGLGKEEASEKALKLLQRFKLEDKADRYATEVSGGQRQRIAIAQQLMADSQFLLMDEPFSGLDPLMKDEACRLICEVAAMDELLTIIVVTHDIEAAVQVADMIWLMGRDRDAAGAVVPGAYIKEQVNLAEMGVAWRQDHWPSAVRDARDNLTNALHKKFEKL